MLICLASKHSSNEKTLFALNYKIQNLDENNDALRATTRYFRDRAAALEQRLEVLENQAEDLKALNKQLQQNIKHLKIQTPPVIQIKHSHGSTTKNRRFINRILYLTR